MTHTPLVELRAAAKTYPNGAAAMADCSFTICDGEFVSLLGPSGCGKSTALRLIAGLSRATAGECVRAWDSGDARSAPGEALACVFQEPTLMPWASVWENVYLPLRLRAAARSAARPQVDEALELVGLRSFACAYPRELSGGMKMRAAVARALVTRPRLLLLDEPFAALDEITRTRLNDDLLSLQRAQRWAALFITHSVYESVYLSNRVLVMSPRPGRIIEEFEIPLPEHRTPDLRTTTEYAALCQRVSASLARAMEAAA